eukprot:scaffold121752_cov29-Tisochrysis_lutea.AAC.10
MKLTPWLRRWPVAMLWELQRSRQRRPNSRTRRSRVHLRVAATLCVAREARRVSQVLPDQHAPWEKPGAAPVEGLRKQSLHHWSAMMLALAAAREPPATTCKPEDEMGGNLSERSHWRVGVASRIAPIAPASEISSFVDSSSTYCLRPSTSRGGTASGEVARGDPDGGLGGCTGVSLESVARALVSWTQLEVGRLASLPP